MFVTAHGDYALKAFDVNAVDYLLKPYDKKRFAEAVQRVVDRSTESNYEMENFCM
jgi:DNA-binding LytR/AlgR family response regulator